MTPNCCVCGKFCPWDSDQSTPFGSYYDTEPPDEEYYCEACAKVEEDHAVASGFLPNGWRKSKWQRRAAERLGLVEVTPSEGAAWTTWSKR